VQLPKTNHVKLPKQNLLKYFTIPEEFYEDIFKNSKDVRNEDLENVNDEDND